MPTIFIDPEMDDPEVLAIQCAAEAAEQRALTAEYALARAERRVKFLELVIDRFWERAGRTAFELRGAQRNLDRALADLKRLTDTNPSE